VTEPIGEVGVERERERGREGDSDTVITTHYNSRLRSGVDPAVWSSL